MTVKDKKIVGLLLLRSSSVLAKSELNTPMLFLHLEWIVGGLRDFPLDDLPPTSAFFSKIVNKKETFLLYYD